jgi:CubicO group peptidase (beta-lactamase class C family)
MATSAVGNELPETRDRLTVRGLLDGNVPELVDNVYFTPIGATDPPVHRLSGELHFAETTMVTVLEDADWQGPGQTIFPEFSVPVLSYDRHLVPLERDIILSGEKAGSIWNVIVAPGAVWQEPGDGGYSRAALPFTLTNNAIGQARNGIAAFIYNDGAISSAAIQITQETAPVDTYVRTELRAIVPVVYEPRTFEDDAAVIAAFEQELAARLPARPWSELPEAELAQARFNDDTVPSDLSAGALLIDGVLYAQSVPTRTAGPFPYPEAMRHGVFSVAKSLSMGLSMFYIAQRHGDDLFEALITDYVPMLADHRGWHGVTFAHTLGMATGVRGGETGAIIHPFIVARPAAAKLRAIRAYPDAAPRPGEAFEYYSTHFFVLSYALNQYVKAREGPDADYWELVHRNVLNPLGIVRLPVQRTIEPDGRLGTPVQAWGVYPTVEEAAKIARLLQNEGRLGDRQVLSLSKVREAMARTPTRGYDTGGNQSYLHSLWWRPADLPGCTVHVPTMSGHGGNLVTMLPNGLVAIRFADDNDYDITPMIHATELYRSSCP